MPVMQMTGNIFLVGLMGAGKTTVGKLLAKRLGKTFYDSDHEIEKKTGVSIPVIFELEQEEGFRKREASVIGDLTQLRDIVLATGGGVVLSKRNREQLSQHGLVIYLCAHPQELWQRTRHDRNRPLLQTENPREKLERLYQERDPLYREIADIVVDTGQQAVTVIVRQLEEMISKHANTLC